MAIKCTSLKYCDIFTETLEHPRSNWYPQSVLYGDWEKPCVFIYWSRNQKDPESFLVRFCPFCGFNFSKRKEFKDFEKSYPKHANDKWCQGRVYEYR